MKPQRTRGGDSICAQLAEVENRTGDFLRPGPARSQESPARTGRPVLLECPEMLLKKVPKQRESFFPAVYHIDTWY